MQSLAVYIHVPFCRQRCSYCHFDVKIFHPQTDRAPFIYNYLAALEREVHCYADRFPGRRVTSIFFGGGTPSRLNPNQIEVILQALECAFSVSEDCEISMEVNPEDVSIQDLEHFCAAGINRVSFGVQSFDDRVLKAVNRAHDAKTAISVIKNATGFTNGVSLDLILGLPYQTRAVMARDLEQVAALEPDHVSLYMLERDLPTPLDKRTGFEPDEDLQADFYEMVRDFLCERGYEHYEISNFSRSGKQCRHNLVYWRCGDYLGLGPAAHGRIGSWYYGNYGPVSQWQSCVTDKGSGLEYEEHWDAERFRQEQIVQGLRLAEGVAMDLLNETEKKAIEPWLEPGLVVYEHSRLKLTPKGRLLANEIFAIFVQE